MMRADRAYELATHFEEINGIKDEIERAIEQAVEHGDYNCEININPETKQSVRNEIVTWLNSFGYDVVMPEYKSQNGCPADQMDYWNRVDVSWEYDRILFRARTIKSNGNIAQKK